MSGEGWDVVGSVIGGVLGTALAGPVGGVLGAASGLLGAEALQGSPAPQAPAPPKPPPYPGSTPDVPPYPTLPAPPGVNPPGSGGAADAAEADTSVLAQIIDRLEELDRSAAATVEAIHAAGTAGRKALEDIQRDVDAKIEELGPRLNTPAGQKELREFLKEKLTSAKQIIDEQIADAEAKARQTREMTQHYLDVAGANHGKPGSGADSDAGGSGGGSRDGADQGTTPASAPGTVGPPTFGQPMMPGMPGASMMPAGLPMPSLPSFGGGGIPGLGGGDPLGALSGLRGAGAHGQDPNFEDDPRHPDSEAPKPHDAANTADTGSDTGSDMATKPAADHQSAGTGTESADNHTHPGDEPNPHPKGTHVALPDGTSTDARTTQGAIAAKAALNGATVTDAWHQAGVTVPPPGTPVTAPIPPTQLKAGDVGVWKDHLVMALGNGKVLVSGQVQPLTSVGSGPDFLGWMNPSTTPSKGDGQGTAYGEPPPLPPPLQPS